MGNSCGARCPRSVVLVNFSSRSILGFIPIISIAVSSRKKNSSRAKRFCMGAGRVSVFAALNVITFNAVVTCTSGSRHCKIMLATRRRIIPFGVGMVDMVDMVDMVN
jgi:hypothetical protein